MAGYTLRFTGFTQDSGPQSSQRFFAHFVVSRGGRQVGLLAPHTDVYPVDGAAVRAVILGSLPRDLFVVAQDPFDTLEHPSAAAARRLPARAPRLARRASCSWSPAACRCGRGRARAPVAARDEARSEAT